MKKGLELCKFGGQILATCTLQMVAGGVITAIMPPNVSVAYKAAVKVGSYLIAGVATHAIDRSVAETFDQIDEIIETIDECKKVLQKKEPEPVSEETSEEEDGE